MLSKLDIGKAFTLQAEVFDKFYFVQPGIGSNADLAVYLADGTPVSEENIPTTMTASLFFDSEGNYYCLNASNKIAQYNFTTLELDELEGQSAIPWTKKFLRRLDDGSFATTRSIMNPEVYDTFSQRYSIDGTLLEEVRISFTGDTGRTLRGEELDTLSGDESKTLITSKFTSNHDSMYSGTATYTASGLLSHFVGITRYYNEFGGTINGDKIYSLNYTYLIVRNLAEQQENLLPIPQICTGSIGLHVQSGVDVPTVNIVLRSIYVSPERKDSLPGEEEGVYTPIWTPGYRVITATTKDTASNALSILTNVRGVNTFELGGEFYTIQDVEEVDSRESLITLIHRQTV